MSNRILLTLLTASLAFIASACAEAPMGSVNAVKARLAAVEAEAGTYAPEAYGNAEDAVGQLDAEVEAQAQNFALVRNYDRTNELIGSVGTVVDAVEEAISSEKEQLRTETGRVVSSTEDEIATARVSIAEVPEHDLPEEQSMAWGADLDVVESSLGETGRLLAGNQLIDAQNAANSALASAQVVNRGISSFLADVERLREEEAARQARGAITIPSAVLADGEELSAGMYLLRLADDDPESSGRWMEFVSEDSVAGRGLAIVMSDDEISEISESGMLRNEARVEVLKEADYVRVWLNRDGVNYLVHLPLA
ncbi:MAG TPA: hypothetical protein EYQ31_12600 [Candidatus Handelsmanbacteria bacterium]|nr:hypothetical protein [Candidatus Handelsmanbacteria bacterium]